ncbi:BMP family ABC transporter substrate-binding protein [Selenomonas ruminantium]|uniref:Nucleoside-binding protein n=1 Tax=Selenomonas ruminantium TaxID=971 RepID=A0A1H0RNK5_SELRU|nr:BMP family ABC transporter substrate-binding protein [Selenomonas ruminantium]SDP30985.1 nucleoside-binding protein [Selenomonas ruminantium]
MKIKDWIRMNFPLALIGMLVVLLVMVIQSFQLPKTESKTVVGCVLVGERADNGWNKNHYEGLAAACRAHDVAILAVDDVAETESATYTAVEELINKGANVIYLTSFGYGQYVDEIARKYPTTAFFCISDKGRAKNCTSYFARLYQARYLAGIIAGQASKTGILGYVSAMPNSQTNRGINAYALGMLTVNPDAQLLVRFTGSWDDEAEERKSVALLQQAGADVITYHADNPYAIDEAEKRGLLSIGCNDVIQQYSDRFLTAVVYDWQVVYEKVLGDYLSGRVNFNSGYWLGLREGAVKLYPLSGAVAAGAAQVEADQEQQMMLADIVFSGVIYDNHGRLRCEEGERISDAELFSGMDWYVKGVRIYE